MHQLRKSQHGGPVPRSRVMEIRGRHHEWGQRQFRHTSADRDLPIPESPPGGPPGGCANSCSFLRVVTRRRLCNLVDAVIEAKLPQKSLRLINAMGQETAVRSDLEGDANLQSAGRSILGQHLGVEVHPFLGGDFA